MVNEKANQDILSKIKPLAELANLPGTVVLCHGTYDHLHLGHVRQFKAARKFGDVLIVTITADKFVNKGPGRPVFNERFRAEMIASIEYVDYVSIVDEVTGIMAINIIKPKYYVKGADYENFEGDITGNIGKEVDAVRSHGGDVRFTHEITFSSSSLINQTVLSEEAKKFLDRFKQQHTFEEVQQYVDRIACLKVLVVGETIWDVYQSGRTIGKTGKAPVVAFEVHEAETYQGGCLAAYNHISNFTEYAHWFSQDAAITKWRYLEGGQKLFETYETIPNPRFVQSRGGIDPYESYDLVVVTDFGHGMLTSNLRKDIMSSANFVSVTAQSNAGNMGMHTIRKYLYLGEVTTFVCIDENELKMATHECYDDYSDLNEIVREVIPFGAITRGEKGCIATNGASTVYVPAFTRNVVDAVGAGDAFLSLAAPLACLGAPPEMIGFVGNCAGAIACSWFGNKYSVTKKQLLKYMETLLK